MRRKILSLILIATITVGILAGCGNEKAQSVVTAENESESAVAETESHVEEADEEEPTEMEEVEETAVTNKVDYFVVTEEQLAGKLRGFIDKMVRQHYLTDWEPTSIEMMRKYYGNFGYIIDDYDEADFDLRSIVKLIDTGICTAKEINYSVNTSMYSSNFNGEYRFYENSDAVIKCIIKTSISSSAPHDSRQKAESEGWIICCFKCRGRQFEIAGIDGYYANEKAAASHAYKKTLVNEDAANTVSGASSDIQEALSAYQSVLEQSEIRMCSLQNLNDSEVPNLVTYEGIYSYEDGGVRQLVDAVELGGIYQIYSGKEDTVLVVGGTEGFSTRTYSVFNSGTFELVDKIESYMLLDDEGIWCFAYMWMSHPNEEFSEVIGNADIVTDTLEQWESEYPNSMFFYDIAGSVEEAYQSYLNSIQ